MKISTKSLIAIALMLTTFLAMFAYVGTVFATQFIDVNNYCWIEGVLDSDAYTLYPYAQESLDIGFSKYGEMIGFNEATEIGLGLQYPGYAGAGDTYDQRDDSSVDPFCNEYINPNWWMNGWFIDIKYRTAAGSDREIWAMALFSDGQHWGGNWYTMPAVIRTSPARPLWQEFEPFANPDAQQYVGIIDPIPPFGGRKTNGQCYTDPIKIIYNGPRSFVALCKTTVSDTAGGADLVAVYFTFIFNKAEKNVIILKDVKRIYTKQPMNIQFGNRGEWDLGMAGDTDSYTHWYTDEPVQYWDMNDDGDLNGTEVETSFEFFKDYMLYFKNPKKWWDDVPSEDRPTMVFDQWTETMVPFPETWLETQPTCYGRDWHWDKTIKEHSYAVAQVISRAGDYVGAMAVWPHPEFWSASNTYYPPARTVAPRGNNPASIPLMLAPISRMLQWHKWTVDEDPNQGLENDLPDRDDIWIKNDDVTAADGTTLEPIIPFLIYEHDFKLSSALPEYRVVSVYMLTDYHDADDADAAAPGNEETWSNGVNVIDREIQYQLDEIFDPWDIYDAMHKETKRWVEFFDRDYAGNAWDGLHYYQINLPEYRVVESGYEIPTLPVYRDYYWDEYCSFSERVLLNTGTGYQLIYPFEYNWLDPIPNEDSPYYTIDLSTGRIAFYVYDEDLEDYKIWYLPTGSMVKVLWSTEETATAAEQWDEYTELYPINGETFIFPLHHDIMEQYKDDTEVLLIEQPPERLIPELDYNITASVRTQVTNELLAAKGTYSPGTEFMLANEYVEYDSVTVRKNGTLMTRDTDYNITWPILDDWTFEAKVTLMTAVTNMNITASYYYYTPAYVTLIDPPNGWYCKELDVKYHLPTTWGWDTGFIEEKFHIDLENATDSLQVRTSYRLGYPMDFVEKAWIHSEKALVGEDYVFHQSTKKLYMQDPVPAGEWLIINYTSGAYTYSDFRLGDGKNTVFTLTAYPDLNSLHVYNTKIVEEIVAETSPDVPPTGCNWKVPKADSYWRSSTPYTYDPAIRIVYEGLQEREWLYDTEEKTRGNWIVHESPTGDYFSTCDELVLDQAPLEEWQVNWPWLRYANSPDWPGQELKIVFKVPSGRYEWGAVGKTAASVDSLGSEMIVAAFKNKLMEFGIGGLDLQDTNYGPRIPWLIEDTISPDSKGRYYLYDDWCYSRTGDGKTTSWPISSSNIISAGGTAVNKITLYFNDFVQARVGTTITGSHGRGGIYAVTCWDRDISEYCFYEFPAAVTERYGYAIISTYKDKNGTVGVIVHGWSGQDTYYAAKWFDEHKFELQHINLHVTDLILKVEYKKADLVSLRCPPIVTVLEKLGTISEKPQHDCP